MAKDLHRQMSEGEVLKIQEAELKQVVFKNHRNPKGNETIQGPCLHPCQERRGL